MLFNLTLKFDGSKKDLRRKLALISRELAIEDISVGLKYDFCESPTNLSPTKTEYSVFITQDKE